MAEIIFDNVSLEYPVLNSQTASIRHQLIHMTTGGRIAQGTKNQAMVKALCGVNFHIQEGDRIGLLGHNGAGKTTLLRCICGIYKPSGGTMKVNGKVTPLIEIGAGIEHELSGYENIRRLQLFCGTHKQDINNNISVISEFSELGDFLHLPVRTYSSGMIMRLMFATITHIKPEILVMDEFFSVGDDSFKQKAEALITQKIQNAPILVFASHSKSLLKKLCNRFFQLEKGTLTEVKL